ncbi:glycosyltransferase family 2 protein [Enterocloster citroniae]|uniref:glycosyltransferase family 2 protein n=2 Tax=Enterocloster citroniae TaxID=358743 RepID=UPI0008E63B77|nr:glycosyltransferase family 2 protein [Enterocloster citroniae]SFS23125.1 Glycosyl transferase family 2 [Enterocloster citroniae]
MNETVPFISIVVPVYNREELLPRCLDTLVYQTLQDIEIIIVDDFSTDHSMEISRKYQDLFSEKVFVYSNDEKGVANAKNKGISMAHGKYVTFVDSDDFVEYWAYDMLYSYAEFGGYSIVCTPYIQITETGNQIIRGNLPDGSVTCDELFNTEVFSLCTKLFRRDLFNTYGYLPKLKIGEDVAFLYPLLTYVEKIGCISTPYYYYQLSENSVTKKCFNLEIAMDIIKGNEIILTKSNPSHYDMIKSVVIKRTLSLMGRFWPAQDLFVEYLQTQLRDSADSIGSQMTDDIVMDVIGMSDISIPPIVYVNAIGCKIDQSYMERLKQTVFRNRKSIEIHVIDEFSCQKSGLDNVRKACADGQYLYASELQALNYIYTTGGIYIRAGMVINCPLDFLKYDGCFFCRETFKEFSSKIWGCMPKHPIIQKILGTYDKSLLYKAPFTDLSQRIKTILLYETGCHLNDLGKQVFKHFNITIYPPTMFLINYEPYINAAIYTPCFYNGTINADKIRQDVITYHINRSITRAVAPKNRRIAYLTEGNNKRINYIVKVEKERDDLLKQIAYYEHSKSWVLTKPLRRILKFINKSRK